MGDSTPSPVVPKSELPQGGVWDNQLKYGGKRLQSEFAAEEPFILWGLSYQGTVPLPNSDKPAPKSVLMVSRLTEPDELIEVGTLSGPIAEMAQQVEASPELAASDFPVEACWETTPTSRELSEAVVLRAIRRWVDPANL